MLTAIVFVAITGSDRWKKFTGYVVVVGQVRKAKKIQKRNSKDERIEEGPEPEIVVVMLQTVGEESCRDALDDGESAVDEGGIRIDEEGAVDADDGADGRPYDRSSDEATEDDPDGSEIDDPASGSDVPVRPAESYDRE